MLKKLLLLALTISLLAGALFAANKWRVHQKYDGPKAPEASNFEEIQSAENELPDSINIEMPFYTQAPHANWDYPWQEACEEASVILVANLYQNLNLELEPYNAALLDLVDWEMEYFGAYEHTSVDQTVEMIEIQYGMETIVHEDPSFEDMQKILAQGHLIIAPFAGKLLENPNYLNGGPVYHMLVIKGYDANKKQIVTHDVGTRNGADYVYSWETIDTALHDWHNEDILLGEKRIIEVLP